MAQTSSVAQYIAKAPVASRKALKQLRAAIRKAAPDATERISYQMPTFDLDGRRMMYIAGFKDHVSLFWVTKAMAERYGEQIAKYRSGKGTLRFLLDKPIPVGLVAKLVKVRVQEHRARWKKKAPRGAA
jgi:uncharacterized protein YdhG (YjbR/CyaY superfamily)